MDLSKEYILMCEKAEKIQKLANDDKGNCFYFEFDGENWIKWQGSHGSEINEGDLRMNGYAQEKLIWLPRQDQLQEMTKAPTGMSKHLFFNDWIDENFNQYSIEESIQVDKLSLEQLGLMFVMKEKFNKKWNGSEWVDPNFI